MLTILPQPLAGLETAGIRRESPGGRDEGHLQIATTFIGSAFFGNRIAGLGDG